MCVLGGAAEIGYATGDMSSAIPDAKPGQCYARVVIPAEYRTDSSTVVVKEASEALKIIPAKFDWVEENRMVSEATTEFKVIPATYATRTETIEVSPAETLWVSGSQYSTAEANPGILALAEAGGANITSAVAGQCYQEFYREPEYSEVTKRVLVAEETESARVVPPRYEWVEEKQMVTGASRLVEIPAVYETVSERVKVEDAQVVWKKGRGSIEKIDNSSGEIMCLVEIPAVYKSINKRVLKSPSTTKVVEQAARFATSRVRKLVEPARVVRTRIPAKYREVTTRVKTANGSHFWADINANSVAASVRKTGNIICKKEVPAKTATINRTVVENPYRVEKVEIPARFQPRKVRRLVSEAQETRVAIPAVTSLVSKRIKVSDPRLVWQQVLCETNTTADMIRRVQTALANSGFEVGVVDGELNESTMSAVEKYQQSKGLATGGLTIELLQQLGVDPG